MISQHIFRAYDIRGVVPEDLNAEAAELIGKGFGTYLIRHLNLETPTIAVGRDGRTHSKELQSAFIHGLMCTGCRVTDVGLAASPLLYFANTVGEFDAGCNITASHNSSEYNGFKLITNNGHAVYGDEIQKIYQIINKADFEHGEGASGSGDYFNQYIEQLKSMFRYKRPMKVVMDTANGVAGAFYPKILRELGHEVIELFTELDGTFPNHEPDPIVERNLKDLKKKVLEESADIGLAFDGDGDRLGLITDSGKFVNADRILMLLTKDALSRHPNGTCVFTVSNSQLLFDLSLEWGGHPVMCKVGHSYVENAMHEHHAILGGEQSGHFFLPEGYYGFDDAMVTACRLLKIVIDAGKPVGKLFDEFPSVFSEPEMRPHCPDDKKFDVLKRVKKYFKEKYPCNTTDGVRIEFGDGAWAGVRVSNTSPCLSVIVEAGSKRQLEKVKSIVLGHLKTYQEINWN